MNDLYELWCFNLVYFIFLYYSLFTEAYRRECLETSVKLLDKLCKGVKPAYNQSYPDIPVICTNLVASVSDFVHCNNPQVCEVNCLDK